VRLIKQIGRIEGAAAARRERKDGPARIGLVWTLADERIEAGLLRPGEFVAVDLVLGPCVAAGECQGCERACVGQVKERVTMRPDDLGVVRMPDGEQVGVITVIDGSMLTWSAEW